MGKHHFLTREGLAEIEAELEHLRSEGRRELADKIKRAKESGGTENNSEYDDARVELSFLEGRISKLEAQVSNASVIDPSEVSSYVQLGSTVVVRDQDGKEERYYIVDGAESNPLEGKISVDSPVARALLGKKAGSKVGVSVPAGTLKLSIVSVG